MIEDWVHSKIKQLTLEQGSCAGNIVRIQMSSDFFFFLTGLTAAFLLDTSLLS